MPNSVRLTPNPQTKRAAKKNLKALLKQDSTDTWCLIRKIGTDVYSVFIKELLNSWNEFAKEQNQPMWEIVE